MPNLLFIAPDIALLTNESVFTAPGERAQDKLDLTSMKVLDRVCEAASCQLIVCGKWRSQTVSPLWWTSFFKMKGLKQCSFIGQTPSSPTPGQAIEDWLRATPMAVDKYAILDSGEGYPSTAPLVTPPPMGGIGIVEALRIIHQLKPSSTVLPEWNDVWSPAK